MTVTELRALLRARGLRLSKRLGQHYLIHPPTIARIVRACGVGTDDCVVEIGAGLGALTGPLAARARRVLAVDVDARVCAALAERMRDARNVKVACQDVLALEHHHMNDAVVVGAIPYRITSPILVWLTERRHLARRAVLVIQQEVARRLVAAPGSRAYGRLSVLAQYGWRVSELFRIPRAAFFPSPAVDSSCVELVPHPQPPVQVRDEAELFAVVKAAFAQRRKTLVNCLQAASALGLTRSQAASAVRALGLPGSVRGEQLSIEQFATLTSAIVAGV